MRLHVFNDSLGYYLRETANRIERLDAGNNLYVNLQEPRYQFDKALRLSLSRSALLKWINALPAINLVYFHFYTFQGQWVLKHLRKKNPSLKVVWVLWSAEIYSLPEFLPSLYDNFSSQFLESKSLYRNIRAFISNIKNKLSGKPFYQYNRFITELGQADFLACLLKHDFENAKNRTKGRFKRIQFAYVSYEQVIPSHLLESQRTGNKIMVNHSGDPSLNHFEILKLLKSKKIDNIIFLPLSYGKTTYIDSISSIATALFGERVQIQREFLEKSGYIEKLLETGYAIFNNKIQQGIGTLLPLLWLGVKVFLRKENAVYLDMKEWGMHIYSIEDIEVEDFTKVLDENQLKQNRSILQDRLSNEMVDEYYLNCLTLKTENLPN